MDNIQQFLGQETLTVSRAMQQIDKNTCGILFLVDKENKLLGCITDGDVRRYLLSGGKMSGPAIEAANRNPRVAKNVEEARRLYHKKNYVVIPIVDESGIVIDLYNGEVGEVNQKQRNALHIPVVINAGGKGTRLLCKGVIALYV